MCYLGHTPPHSLFVVARCHNLANHRDTRRRLQVRKVFSAVKSGTLLPFCSEREIGFHVDCSFLLSCPRNLSASRESIHCQLSRRARQSKVAINFSVLPTVSCSVLGARYGSSHFGSPERCQRSVTNSYRSKRRVKLLRCSNVRVAFQVSCAIVPLG